jgi:uncharacterized membrane protein YbhN (UPF0104 family)
LADHQLIIRRRLVLALKVFLSVALIAYLLRSVSLGETWEEARRLSAWAALPALALLLVYSLIGAVRWWLVLRAMGCAMALADAGRITLVALFFNQFLPSSVGADAVRVWQSSRGGMPAGAALCSVLLERWVHLLGLSLMAAGGATLLGGEWIPRGMLWALWAVFLASACGFALLAAVPRLARSRLFDRIRDSADELAGYSRALLSPGVPTIGAFLAVVAGQFVLAGAVLVLIESLSIPAGLRECLALLPAVVLVASLPVSIAGWGVREYALVTAFGYAGVPSASAMALSLMLGFFTLLASIPGGLLWFARRGGVDGRLHRP